MNEEDESDDLPAESGSFFNFFEIESDPFDVSANKTSGVLDI